MTPDALAVPAPAPASSRAPERGRVRRAASRVLSTFLLCFLPTVVAAHAAGLAWSTQGFPSRGVFVAAAVFGVAFLATLGALLWVLRRPRARFALKVLVAAHVVFWTAKGLVIHASRGEAGPVRAPTASAWEAAPQAFLAGTGEASFRLTDRDVVAGYGSGARRRAFPWPMPGPLGRASLAWMGGASQTDGGDGVPRVPMFASGTPGDDLGARALVLRPAAGTAPPLAVCRLDLVMVDAALSEAIARNVADLGITPDTLLVCATHTHCGPGGFTDETLAQVLATDHFRREVRDRVVDAASAAVRTAHRDAVPARIGFVRARDEDEARVPILAKSRRRPEGPVDREVLGLRLDAENGRRLALLLCYGVHPTWGRPSDTTFSRDVAGALEDSAAIADGATTLFVNGAVGDVKPRFPAARSDRFRAFESAVAAPLREPAREARLRVAAASVARDLGPPRFLLDLAGPREGLVRAGDRLFGGGLAESLADVGLLPINAWFWCVLGPDGRVAGSLGGSFGVVCALDPWMERTTFRFGAVRLETPGGTAVLCWLPGEAGTSVGERVKAAGRLAGGDPVMVLGVTNGYLGYVAGPAEYAAGGYDARCTLFGPETATRIEEAVAAALAAAGSAPRATPRR
jgi:hypothetical protein